MRGFIAALVVLALPACLDGSDTVDDIARNSAKTVVNGIVEARYPGVDVSVATDCIIDNASAAEIVTIAQAAVVGTTSETTALVTEIGSRPETLRCIAEDTVGAGNIIDLISG